MGNNLPQKAKDQIKAAQNAGSTELILKECALKALPASIAKKFKHVKKLVLERNYIPLLPKQIVYFQDLEILNLDNNELGDLPPEILELGSLKHLSVARNVIKQLPEPISKLNKLEILCLDGNPIHALPSDFSKLAPHLREFYYAAAGINQVPASVWECRNLRCLSVAANKLAVVPEVLGDLQELQWLSIENCPIQNLPLFLTKLKKLTYLNASGCPFGDLDSYPFGEMCVDLKELHLQGCKLTRISRTIGNLKKLEVLDLSINLFKEIPKEIGHIGGSLGKLLLNENQLKALPGELALLDPAMHLELRGNDLRAPFTEWEKSITNLFDALQPYMKAWGPLCTIEGEAATQGVRNQGLSFKVFAKDYKGKPRVNGGDLFEVSMIKETQDDIYQVETFIKDGKNGQYEVFYNARQAGDYKLSISCEGIALKGSPFTITVFDM